MSPDHPLTAHNAAAEVLLDKVQLGIEVLLPTVSVSDARRFCDRLASLGVLSGRLPPDSVLGVPLSVGASGIPLDESGQGRFLGELRLADSNGSLAINRSSRLILNPLRDLRTQLVDPGQVASYGNDNVVWEFGAEWRHLLGWQVANVDRVVGSFLASVAAAADVDPSLLRGCVRVQSCEVLRDHAVPDASAMVRELRDHPIPGVVQEVRTVASRYRNLDCVAWKGTARTAPQMKVYAKRRDLLRHEVTLQHRSAVRALLAGHGDAATRADLGGQITVGRLLEDVARACAPLVAEVEHFVSSLASLPARSGLDLLLGFAPLVRLAAPLPRPTGAGGRPPGAGVAVQATHALEALLYYASFDARGLGDSSAVLLALREMAEAGTLVPPPRGRRLFVLQACLNPARLALASARVAPRTAA